LIYVYINNFIIDQDWDVLETVVQVPSQYVGKYYVDFLTMASNVQYLENGTNFWITKFEYTEDAQGVRNINLYAS
jgi:hypothetical protein